jgi:hypothetical protein
MPQAQAATTSFLTLLVVVSLAVVLVRPVFRKRHPWHGYCSTMTQ